MCVCYNNYFYVTIILVIQIHGLTIYPILLFAPIYGMCEICLVDIHSVPID